MNDQNNRVAEATELQIIQCSDCGRVVKTEADFETRLQSKEWSKDGNSPSGYQHDCEYWDRARAAYGKPFDARDVGTW